MANVILRSYQQIEGSMLSRMLAETDLTSLSPGSYFLTSIQAAASSDFVQEGKLLKILEMRNIEKSTGSDLEDLAQEMGVTPKRIGSQAARGKVTIQDSAFSKISTNIYSGTPSAIAGDTVLYVIDASSFFASGSIYIGRNSASYEKINYSSVTNYGAYWGLALSGPLTKDHLVGEEVVLAQGGDRTIAANTVVSVPSGGGPGVDFKTKIDYVILDGEDILSNIDVTCTTPGVKGNVGINKISTFQSPPFTTAVVFNELPTQAGKDTETDPELRLRIKGHVHEIGKGTKKAIYRAVIGTSDPDQGNRVVSAFLREPTSSGQMGFLFIDDSTGFSPTFSGIGEETIVTSAVGTEQFLQLQKWPIVRAQTVTIAQEPFLLYGGENLLFESDGISETKLISADYYRSPGAVTAQEITEAINALFTKFEARAKDGKVFVSPIAEDPDYVRCGDVENNANSVLRFPAIKQYTIRLYKNDKLLNKSGKPGVLQSKPQNQWPIITSPATINIEIDGIQLSGISISDLDFATYTSSLNIAGANASDWAIIFNKKLPGITAVANDDTSVSLTSNKGNSDSASVYINGGTLNGTLFTLNSGSTGISSQFKLNKLLGQIELTDKLNEGDELKAGTVNTRAFLDSDTAASFNMSSLGTPKIAVVADASVTQVAVLQSGTVTFTSSSGIQRVTGFVGQFSNVKANDYAVLYGTPREGLLKVYAVAGDGSYVDFYDPNPVASGSIALTGTTVRVSFFRTDGTAQLVTLPSGVAVTNAAIITSFNSQVSGATATLQDTGSIRFTTDRFANDGGIFFPVIAGSAINLGIAEGGVLSNDPHIASIESDDLAGYPEGRFLIGVADNTSPFTSLNAASFPFADNKYFNRPVIGYIGANEDIIRQPSDKTSSSDLVLRNALPYQNVGIGPDMRGATTDAMQFGENDNIVFVLDEDAAKKTFNVPMYVEGTVAGPTPPSSSQFDANDNTGASLGTSSRWLAYDFADYKFIVRSRKDLTPQGTNTNLRARAVNFGDNGKNISVGITYPSTPGLAQSSSFDYDAINDDIKVNLVLASGAERIIGLTPSAPVYVKYTGALPYTYEIQFVPNVNLATVLIGDVLSLNDQSFSLNNRGVMRITAIDNLTDASKTYQHLIENIRGDISGGTTMTLGASPTQTVRNGDKVTLTGRVADCSAIPSNSTSATVTASALGTVTVASGSLFKNLAGSFSFGVNTYYYTTYNSATGTFSGVSASITGTPLLPAGTIPNGSLISQSSLKVGVPTSSPFSLGPATFVANLVTYSYAAYDSNTGYFYDVSPSPIGAIAIGDDIFQAITPSTAYVSSGTYPTFTLGSALANGANYMIEITHAAVTVSSSPSFTPLVNDRIQILSNIYKVTTVYSSTELGIDNPFNFTGVQSGILSRIKLTATRMQPGTNEDVQVLSSQSLRVFEIDSVNNSALAMVTTVNNTAGVNNLISLANGGTSDGSGLLLMSTEDLLANGTTHESLINASSYISSSVNANPSITLKYPLDASLESGEVFRLIPMTPKNVKDHLSKKQISGLAIAADITLTNTGRKVQVSTKTPGGAGQVYAVGGRAAGVASMVVKNNSQEMSSNRAILELESSAREILAPGHVIKLSQSNRSRKEWTSGDPLISDTIAITVPSTGVGQITCSKKFATILTYSHSGTLVWAVKKISKDRVRYEKISGTCTIPAGLKSGDWAFIGDGSSYAGVTPLNVFAAANKGLFQVVETDNANYFDVDNASAIEEFVTTSGGDPFVYTSYHSAQIGDQLVLGALLPIATENKGTFTITEVVDEFTVKYSNPTVQVQTSVALGSGNIYIYLLDQGYTTYRKVVMVLPKPSDPTNRSLVTVSPGYDIALITESNAARVYTPNRLGFSNQPVPGMNGYSYWTGLKQRVQYVLDGYAPDSTTFPGTRAAGVGIEVREPQIQRVELSLRIKTKEGVALSSIADSIKNSIVGYVNSLGLGQDVVLSEIISLVQQTPGVDAVVFLLPDPSTERITIADKAIARTSTSEVVISQ